MGRLNAAGASNGTKTLEFCALSFTELSDMLARYADNVEMTKVIEDAMQRRVSNVAVSRLPTNSAKEARHGQ